MKQEHWSAAEAAQFFKSGKRPYRAPQENTTAEASPGNAALLIHKTKRPRSAGMNKTESRFVCEYLEPHKQDGVLKHWEYEAFKIRLAEHQCWYTPDFMAVDSEGKIWMIEVKGGFEQEDARVKRLVAARMVREMGMRFLFAQLKGKTWTYTEL
ncbi:hypothetical protein [Desulfovibrio inopinatus]|uniref:hypothetical protein n=1 Tax=Desulfovibrio inopinatus TaxID=102109 RepID=UPI0006876520|nr:hypothetical protein [Desulfovibrio inopinatus]